MPKARSVFLAFALATPLALAGCLGSDEEAPELWLVLELPGAQLTPGAPSEFELLLHGGPVEVLRVGLGVANSTTEGIPEGLLTEAAFDEVFWSHQPVTAPARVGLVLDPVPESRYLWLRGVAETDDGMVWSAQVRVPVEEPEAAPVPVVRIQGLPDDSYHYNIHTVRVNVTGPRANATQVGFAWSISSTADRDPDSLRPALFDAHHSDPRPTVAIPARVAFPDWVVPVNSTIHLRAWAIVNETLHWSDEQILESRDPPAVDTRVEAVDHVVRIEPALIPLPLLDSFEPESVEIKRGETVQWINEADSGHTASHDDNETAFHTGNLAAGVSSLPFRFLVPGEYPYLCRLHPDTMTGTVIVTE